MKTTLLILAIALGLTACKVQYEQQPTDASGTVKVSPNYHDDTHFITRRMNVICVDGYKFVKYTSYSENPPVQILNENGGGVPCQQ